ncbi:cytosine permease [Streptomyces sp. NPDC020996]|uniref:purine-cytosine permease family protein n=1 Tax=Streptomyces sp. NPDC020996 TaxID=3154791 RepID=UPI0033F3DF14
MNRSEDRATHIEQHSIEWIPAAERHGTPRGLFPVWFGANVQLTTLITGALAVELGLSLPWGLLAIVAGNLFGAVFMALHSAQGPKLGVPQMIQSRAQFGFYGAVVPILLVILMYIGFFASSGVLAGDALSAATPLGPDAAIVGVSVVCVVVTVFGYRMIHLLERASSVLSGLVLAYLTVLVVTSGDLGSVWHPGPFHGGVFLLMLAIAATWQIAYAPYVADYSRYLPEHSSTGRCFWWSYAGTVTSSVWMMALGAVGAALAPQALKEGFTGYLLDLVPGALRWPVAAALVLGIIAVNVLNLYGAFMSFTTTATAIRRFSVTRTVRTVTVLAAGGIGTYLAVAGRTSFIDSYENFILFLTCFLVPWTSINLVDFYFIRRERYDIAALFRPDGRYGLISWRTMAAYVAGVAIEIPFMSASFYTGPMVARLGGADISWILGLLVSAVLYHLVMRDQREAVSPEAERVLSV